MKNSKVRKTIFYISLISYIYILFMSLYYGVFGYTVYDKVYYGLNAIGNFIFMFWFNAIFENHLIFPIILCVIYQICYLLNRKKNVNIEKKINFKKIFFILSISIWVLLFLYGIYSFFFGYEISDIFKMNTTKVYGFKAFYNSLLWIILALTFIPILPMSLIYIIVYIVTSKK